jgi:acetyl/propionyl-CoA carboxylase alpha subunit
LKEMGIQPVTIHSDVDADSPHVLAAPTAINIGGHDAGSSYLQVRWRRRSTATPRRCIRAMGS